MKNRGSIISEICLSFLIVGVFFWCFSPILQSEKNTKINRVKIQETYKHVATIIASTTPGSCKEMNLRYYHWFKSHGVMPEVVVGKKLEQGHLWLKWEGNIYDATDYHYNNVSAKELSNVYVPAEFEVIK